MQCLDLSLPVNKPATLGVVSQRLNALSNLSPTQRRDLASAVRAVAKFAGTVPDAVGVEVPALREVLDEVQPGRFKMSQRRLANIRSLFVQALILAGVDVEPLRLQIPLTEDWQRLRALLSPLERHLIARFAQHCSAQGIAPAAVTEAVVAAYHDKLVNRSFVRRPRTHVRNLIRCWNEAQAREAAWPPTRLTPRVGRKIVSRPLDDFPLSFQRDLQAWLDRLAGADPLADTPFKPARPATIDSRRSIVRRCASILTREGWEPTQITSLGALVEPDAAKRILRWHLARSGDQPSWYSQAAASVLLAIARHWCRVDREPLEKLQAMARRCQPLEQGMSEKNRNTLRLFENEQLVGHLLKLPERLMRRALGGPEIGEREAFLAAVALGIAVLTCAPVRIENLVGIEIDRHIVRCGTGRRAEVRLHFPAHGVKNARAIELPLSAEAANLLDRYLQRARSVLAAPGCRYLFPGRSGQRRSKISFSNAISQTIERELGVRVTPHQFRHLTGCLYLRQFPGEYETVRALLGHKRLQTTIQFYAGMETLEAARRFDAAVLAPRRRGLGARR